MFQALYVSLYFSVLLHWCITRSLISVSNAGQTVQSLLYFKISLKSHLIGTCFRLIRPSSGSCSLIESVTVRMLMHIVVHTKMYLFENKQSLFARRCFHFAASMLYPLLVYFSLVRRVSLVYVRLRVHSLISSAYELLCKLITPQCNYWTKN
jgi:hypothetical protein